MRSVNTIKKGDFVLLDYTGKSAGIVFDTTEVEVAKLNKLEQMPNGSVYAVIGEPFLIPGLNTQLEGKNIGENLHFKFEAADGFGKKNPKLLQLIPTQRFLKDKIKPLPGMPVDVDGNKGMILTVAGGRTIVDFNHPLAGKELEYDVHVKKIIHDDSEKIHALLKTQLGLNDAKVEILDGIAIIKAKNILPKELAPYFTKEVVRLIPNIKDTKFEETIKNEEPKANTNAK